VATATTERAFSAKNISIKNRMRNRMADDWINNCLVTYIERDVFVNVEKGKIYQYFQNFVTYKKFYIYLTIQFYI
jgi:hypothetical protein